MLTVVLVATPHLVRQQLAARPLGPLAFRPAPVSAPAAAR
jgi:hypothetical protein